VDPDLVEIVEGGELEEELVPDPSGPETAVVADYVEVSGASECDPGHEDGETDLSLISEASTSSSAEASRDAYIDPATTIENDPTHPDYARAGVRTDTILGTERTSYVVPVNDDETSAVITPASENTTILITGDFDKATVDDIASELELR
jgi:hypothetical protein